MGSRTSTSRHQALSDAHQSGIPGIPPVPAASGVPGCYSPPFYIDTDNTLGTSYLLKSNDEVLSQPGRSPTARDSKDESDMISCVFTWNHGGQNVYLLGSFIGWGIENKIKLVRSGHEFTVIYELPRGVHYYKFIVDDQWRFAPDQQTQRDEHGNVNNVLDIRHYEHYNYKIPTEYDQAKHKEYHQIIPEGNDYTADAPTIPILLSKSIACETLFPKSLPLHCVSNHVYQDVNVAQVLGPHVFSVAVTQRWRDSASDDSPQKYTTYTYVTINPLFSYEQPTDQDKIVDFGVINPLISIFQ